METETRIRLHSNRGTEERFHAGTAYGTARCAVFQRFPRVSSTSTTLGQTNNFRDTRNQIADRSWLTTPRDVMLTRFNQVEDAFTGTRR